jgi:hypothetical protein
MTSLPFTQIEPSPWPSGHGDLVAVISTPIEILSDRYGLSLFQGSDNLDAYRAAAVRLRSGRHVGLLRHEGAPVPGTELHADAADDFLSALREFLDAFELSADDLQWVREDVPLDHLRLEESTARS